MTLLHRLASVLGWVFHRKRAEQRLDDELQAFIDMSAAEKMRDGLLPADARRLAMLELGGIEQAKERVRTYRHGALLDEVGRDVQYAFRMFVRNPGFTVIIVLTLALGIGANTAIFSLIDALMLRWLPVRNPQELVQLTLQTPGARGPAGGASPTPSSVRWPVGTRSSRAWRVSAASVLTWALPVPSVEFLEPSSPAATTRHSA